jgi:serine/threonine-protein kinase
MATVYAATHRNQKRVAIKMLHPEVSIDEQVKLRFTREGYVANTVGHPGVVSVLDDDVTEDGAAFLVMELLEGETLDRRWEKAGRLPPADVLDITDQLLDVLAAAHAKGILHRDLKPENLLLTHGGQLKVLDFGIARVRELTQGQSSRGGAEAPRQQDSGSTRSGSLLGTPAFMAPEQARGRWEDVDERTDIWAVGATMYTLMSGRFVHETDTLNEQLIQNATQPAEPIAKACPDLPESVAHVVDRALAYERSARWPDARSFQQAVRDARPLAVGTVSASSSRPRASSGRPADPTVVVPYAAISSHTLRSGTSSTHHPMRAGSSAGSFANTSRLFILGGASVALLAGAVIYALRGPLPPAGPATPSAAAATNGAAPAPRSLEPSSVDLQEQLVESNAVNSAGATHVGLKADKPPKPAKPGGKPPAPRSPETAHSVAPTPPSASDLFEKRH